MKPEPFDIDYLRALSPRRGDRAVPLLPLLLVLAGLSFFAAENYFLRDLSRRQEAAVSSLEGKGGPIDEEAGRRLAAARRVAGARADRVLWKTLLLALEEAVPPDHSVVEIDYERSGGICRVVLSGRDPAGRDRVIRALRADPRWSRFFPFVADPFPMEEKEYLVSCMREERR